MKTESIHEPTAGQPGWVGTPLRSALRRVLVTAAIPIRQQSSLSPHWVCGVVTAAAMALAIPASADVTVTFTNKGTSVVASYSGSVNTTVLGNPKSKNILGAAPAIKPFQGYFQQGGRFDLWANVTLKRTSGGAGSPNNGYGTAVGLISAPLKQGGEPFNFGAAGSSGVLGLYSNYKSGSPIKGTVEYPNMTVASLGIVNTEYTFTGGQKIIIVNGSAVPEIAAGPQALQKAYGTKRLHTYGTGGVRTESTDDHYLGAKDGKVGIPDETDPKSGSIFVLTVEKEEGGLAVLKTKEGKFVTAKGMDVVLTDKQEPGSKWKISPPLMEVKGDTWFSLESASDAGRFLRHYSHIAYAQKLTDLKTTEAKYFKVDATWMFVDATAGAPAPASSPAQPAKPKGS